MFCSCRRSLRMHKCIIETLTLVKPLPSEHIYFTVLLQSDAIHHAVRVTREFESESLLCRIMNTRKQLIHRQTFKLFHYELFNHISLKDPSHMYS